MKSSPTDTILRTTPSSFLQFLKEADHYLDAHGVPVAFRRFFIKEWCDAGDQRLRGSPLRRLLKTGLGDLSSSSPFHFYNAILHWYYDVYGELAYRAPFLSVLGRVDPNYFFECRIGLDTDFLLLPKSSTNEEQLNLAVAELLRSKTRIAGLFALRSLPLTRWTQLAAAEYEASLSALFFSRPSYHLSMWSSHQTAEKILKAALLAHKEWDEPKLADKINHKLCRAADELEELGFALPAPARSALKRLDRHCGPNIRYSDDYSEQRRIDLRNKAWQAHNNLLEFAAEGFEPLRLAFLHGSVDGSAYVVAKDFLSLTSAVFDEFLAWSNEADSFPFGIGNEGLTCIDVTNFDIERL